MNGTVCVEERRASGPVMDWSIERLETSARRSNALKKLRVRKTNAMRHDVQSVATRFHTKKGRRAGSSHPVSCFGTTQ